MQALGKQIQAGHASLTTYNRSAISPDDIFMLPFEVAELDLPFEMSAILVDNDGSPNLMLPTELAVFTEPPVEGETLVVML